MALRRFREIPTLQKMPKNEREWVHYMNELGRWATDIDEFVTAQADIVTAQATATSAQTQADYSGYRSIGDVVNLHTDATGTQPANGTTRDLTAYFYDEAGTEIATRTLRGTYATATDTFTVAAQATTGETTTYALENDGTDAVRATVEHTASGAKATLGWTFLDETVAGSVPVTGGSK